VRAVKLCTNKILQFLTGGAAAWKFRLTQVDLYNGRKTVVVVVSKEVSKTFIKRR